jgi:hypothetical protein
MEGLTKVSGIGTEDIIAFLDEHSMYYEITPSHVSATIGPSNGYPVGRSTCAFKSSVNMHPDNRNKVNAKFATNHEHGSYRALYKVDNPNFLEKVSGLVEIIDGLVVVDTQIGGTTEYRK